MSLWGLLIPIRREFHQYANLRPITVMEGVPSPVTHALPGEVDFAVVRENNEGGYSREGGRLGRGPARERAVRESVLTRHGVERVLAEDRVRNRDLGGDAGTDEFTAEVPRQLP